MRLRHIEVFQAVMETGSMSAAARLIHLTQSAVSRSIANAELQLGYPLFHRVGGKEVWLDVEGIADGEVFPEAIKRAIEQSDAFLFVITPDSLASGVCARELGHAVEQHKRLVPVLRRNADGKHIPEALAARNWTFFRAEDDFAASLERLVGALDTDLAWVDAHTRLLGRALEWEKNGKDASFLLRGCLP